MNKQEAIEKIKNIETLNVKDRMDDKGVDVVIKNQVIDLVSQIDKPHKVTIPKFVADWYEKNKDDLNTAIYDAIISTYKKVNGENDDFLDTFESWLVYGDNSILTLVQMQLFGYEIEKEKLHTVELLNPNIIGNEHTVLVKNGFKKIVMVRVYGDNWRTAKGYHLTESEIRKDFEWAFQFAKEVE